MKTIKIKPSHESQGAFVLINEEDFNPELHELLEAEQPSAEAPKRVGRAPKAKE